MATSQMPHRNTDTNAHKYVVHRYVRRCTSGPGCWFLKESTKVTIHVKTLGETIMISRYLYALFIGPIPNGQALTPRPTDRLNNKQCCNTKGCINPYHQSMESARNSARGLNLDVCMDLLDHEFSPKEVRDSAPIPANITKRAIILCKYLHSQKKTFAEISAGCGLPNHEIMKAINGRYDHVLRDTGNPIRERAKQSFFDDSESREDIIRARSEMLKPNPLTITSDQPRSEDQSKGMAKVDSQAKPNFGPGRGDPGDDEGSSGAPAVATPPAPRDPSPATHGPGPTDVEESNDPDDLGSTDEDAWLASLRGN